MQINENFEGDKFRQVPKNDNDNTAIRKELLNNRIREFFTNDGKLDREEKRMLRNEGFSKKEIKQAVEEYTEYQNDVLAKQQEMIERYKEIVNNKIHLENTTFGLKSDNEKNSIDVE